MFIQKKIEEISFAPALNVLKEGKKLTNAFLFWQNWVKKKNTVVGNKCPQTLYLYVIQQEITNYYSNLYKTKYSQKDCDVFFNIN